MTKYKMELVQSKNRKWFTRIRHRNGRKLWTSELYSSRSKAWKTAYNFLMEMISKIKYCRGNRVPPINF